MNYIRKTLGEHEPIDADWQVPAWELTGSGLYLVEDDYGSYTLVLRLPGRVDEDGNDLIDEIEEWLPESYDDEEQLERAVIRDLRTWRLLPRK